MSFHTERHLRCHCSVTVFPMWQIVLTNSVDAKDLWNQELHENKNCSTPNKNCQTPTENCPTHTENCMTVLRTIQLPPRNSLSCCKNSLSHCKNWVALSCYWESSYLQGFLEWLINSSGRLEIQLFML